MAKQFADFSSLKDLRKALEKEPAAQSPASSKAPVQQKRSRVVEKRPIHEEHARNAGYSKGQQVRMMDSNDVVTIVGFHKDSFELAYPDGLTFTALRSEFIVINQDEDRAMYRSVPKSPKKQKDHGTPASTGNDTITVDLHLERIPGSESIPEWAALDYQMDYFRRIVRNNLRHKGKKIVFIHGFGDGRLKDCIRRELDEVFAVSCSYQSGTADNYGPGTVIVTIR